MNTPVILLALLAATLSGCATKDYVKEQVAPVNQRVDTQASRLEGMDTTLKSVGSDVKAQGNRISQDEAQIGQTSKLAQDALDRANAANVLAEGKLIDEMVLSDDKVKFAFGKFVLSKDAMAALDEFAGQLKSDNKNVYVEIQGHTDSVGSAAYNKRLGQERAEAVRDYLNQAGIPLHRMNVISYGETRPVTDNKTREHRKQNRRVVLEVLK
ncbi:MAG TPA: OmpA family protein [Thiobacillaceae bacterium]|nr:OmpA family protein [Thiobacillaceae bacterium]